MSESARKRLFEMNSNWPFIRAIVRIQAFVRGYQVRKRLEKVQMVMLSGTEGGKFADDIDSDLLLANQTVKEIYEKHGPY